MKRELVLESRRRPRLRSVPRGGHYDCKNQLATVATMTIKDETATATPPPTRRTSLSRSDFIKSSGCVDSFEKIRRMPALEA